MPIITTFRKKVKSGRKVLAYDLECPNCGKKFSREKKAYTRGVLKSICSMRCREQSHRENGFDFQLAYDVDYRPSVELELKVAGSFTKNDAEAIRNLCATEMGG